MKKKKNKGNVKPTGLLLAILSGGLLGGLGGIMHLDFGLWNFIKGAMLVIGVWLVIFAIQE